MKRMASFAFLMVLVLSLAGCIGGKATYYDPLPEQGAQTSILSSQTKDIVWKKMVAGIGDSFFVINNLDKESGFINMSYGGDPCRFVDCGRINSDVSNAAGKRSYNFPACSSYQEYEGVKNGYLFGHKRSMSLVGRANIIIQEVDGGTYVKVNVRYVVQKKIQIYNAVGRLVDTFDDSISFNSNGSGTFPQATKCVANGKFEREILDIVRD